MTLSDRLRSVSPTVERRVRSDPSGVPASGERRICNDPSGCYRPVAKPDQARCEDHVESWVPEWLRRQRLQRDGLARDLTGLESL
jgi:hypothetical protein